MADVIIDTKINDAYVARCAAAIPKVINSAVTVSVQGSHNRSDGADISGSKGFNLPIIAGETVKHMAERISSRLLLKVCQVVETSENQIATDAAHAAIPSATSDLPDDAIE